MGAKGEREKKGRGEGEKGGGGEEKREIGEGSERGLGKAGGEEGLRRKEERNFGKEEKAEEENIER